MDDKKAVDEYTTYQVAKKWFRSLSEGDTEAIASCLDENIEFINYTKVPGVNDIMPWIGTYHGRENVMSSLKVFLGVAEVKFEEVIDLVVSGENAMGIVHEISTIKETGMDFEIEFVQWMKVRHGKIVRWKSYTDPSPILLAIRGGRKF